VLTCDYIHLPSAFHLQQFGNTLFRVALFLSDVVSLVCTVNLQLQITNRKLTKEERVCKFHAKWRENMSKNSQAVIAAFADMILGVQPPARQEILT
jgi:hypothetical protein